ncbi:MAG TPA: DUF1501 domain-containing protein, partial [Blastocatellia bacterium]|nr:DUF1501 domain-containing protein [Blastocatellia bacterium]
FNTDGRFTRDRNNQVRAFRDANSRAFTPGTFLHNIADTGVRAYNDAVSIQTETAKYNPTGYPNTGLGNALKMVAQLMVTIPTTCIAHVAMGGFDTHTNQIVNGSKVNGGQAGLLQQFSQAVKAFYDDLAAHGLSQNTLIQTYSEFARRPAQNANNGTDHGRAASWFVIGDGVRKGMYSDQPSLSSLDGGGNQRETCDFRQIYAEILDKWFAHDSRAVLGSSFNHLGFLP